MAVTTLSSREFNQDTGRAKIAARSGPVFITDRGRPGHVLLTFEDYQRLTGGQDSIIPYAGTWSARRGAYCVLYEIDDEQRVVTVTAVDHPATCTGLGSQAEAQGSVRRASTGPNARMLRQSGY